MGAYHRATPSGGANANITDARAEADHYLDVASPAVGDPIPRSTSRRRVACAARPGGVGEGMGDPGDEPPGRETDAVRESELLTVNMGNSTWFADTRYRSVARALERVLSDGSRERVAGPRLDLLAVDAQAGPARRYAIGSGP